MASRSAASASGTRASAAAVLNRRSGRPGGNGSRSTSTRKSITNTAAPANIHGGVTSRGQRRSMPASQISTIMITVMTRTAARPPARLLPARISPVSSAAAMIAVA